MLSVDERRQEERLTKAVEVCEARIQRLEAIRKDARRPGLVALLEDVKVSIQTSQAMRDALTEGETEMVEGRTDGDFKAAVRFWGGQIRAYKGVLANVEHVDEKIAVQEELIAKSREQLRQLRAQRQEQHNDMPVSRIMPRKGRSIV